MTKRTGATARQKERVYRAAMRWWRERGRAQWNYRGKLAPDKELEAPGDKLENACAAAERGKK